MHPSALWDMAGTVFMALGFGRARERERDRERERESEREGETHTHTHIFTRGYEPLGRVQGPHTENPTP